MISWRPWDVFDNIEYAVLIELVRELAYSDTWFSSYCIMFNCDTSSTLNEFSMNEEGDWRAAKLALCFKLSNPLSSSNRLDLSSVVSC